MFFRRILQLQIDGPEMDKGGGDGSGGGSTGNAGGSNFDMGFGGNGVGVNSAGDLGNNAGAGGMGGSGEAQYAPTTPPEGYMTKEEADRIAAEREAAAKKAAEDEAARKALEAAQNAQAKKDAEAEYLRTMFAGQAPQPTKIDDLLVGAQNITPAATYDKLLADRQKYETYAWMNNYGAPTIDQSGVLSGQAAQAQAPSGSYFLDGYGAPVVAGVSGQGLSPETIQQMQQNQAGQLSLNLLQELQARATGASPQASAAQKQLQAATEQTLAAQQAAAANARGQFNPAVMRQLQQQSASALQSAANQSAQLRAQEQQQAAQTAAGLGTTLQGQNIQALQSGQELATQVSMQNAQLEAQRQNQEMALRSAATLQQRAAEVDTSKFNAAEQNEWKKFVSGQQVDLAKTGAAMQQQMAITKFNSESTAREGYLQDLRKAITNDAQFEQEAAKFNSTQNVELATRNADLINQWRQGNEAATIAFNTAVNAAKVEYEKMGLTKELAEKQMLVDLQKIASAEAIENQTGCFKPSILSQYLGVGSDSSGFYVCHRWS
jgi:hypothetical protein